MAECYYEPTPATDGATMNPVPGAVFQVFEIADTGFTSPLSLRVGAGNPTTTVTASESLATLPGVWVTSPNFEHIWKSGTFEWRRDSIDGAKAAIQDAKVAAQLAAENAAAELSARIAAGEFQGEPGRDGSNVVPTAQAIATEISTEGTPANTALNATFADSFGALSAAVYGVDASASAATNSAALQDAITDALAAGRDVQLPATAAGEEILIDTTLTVPTPGGITIFGAGVNVTKIRQTTKPYGVFDVTGPNVTIRDMSLTGDGLDMTGLGTSENYSKHSGVWLNVGSSGSRVYNVSGKDLHRVVRLEPGYRTDPATHPNLTDIIVDGITSDRCWCAVTGVGITNTVIRNIRGTYLKATSTDATDTGQPPHLIYIVDGTEFWANRINSNVQTSDCMAWDSTIGKAYAFKGIIGGAATNLYARACHGILDLIANVDFKASGIYSSDDVYPASGAESAFGSLSLASGVRTTVDGAQIRFKNMDHGPGFFNQGTENCLYRNIEVVANRVTESTGEGGPACFILKGVNDSLENPVATSIGANIFAGVWVVTTGSGAKVINPTSRGKVKYGVYLMNMDGALIDYDPGKLQVTTDPVGSRAKSVGITASATNPTIRPRDRTSPNITRDVILWDSGLNLPAAGNGPSRLASGHVSSVFNGTWTSLAGDPDNLAYDSANSATAICAYPTGAANVRVETVMKYAATHADSRPGVAIKAVDTSNFIGVGFGLTGLQVMTRTAGADTTVATIAGTTPVSGRIYRLAVEVYGAVIDLFIDGAKVGSYTMTAGEQSTFLAATAHGYYANRCGNSRWYGITVRKLA